MCLHLYQLISIARYVLKSLSIGFRGKKFDIICEHVLCTSIVLPGWLIQQNCQVQYYGAMVISLSSFSSESAIALLQESYTFVQRHPFLASI